jgi:nucleotide-binding universal stress UspA family protein
MDDHLELDQLSTSGPRITALSDLDPAQLARSVVVGVDDSAQAVAAARWAARAAEARGLDLVLLHGRSGGEPGPADETMYEVAARLRLPPRMRIALVVDDEELDRLLTRVSRTAALVVIGQDRLHPSGLEIGKAAARSARHSCCPVVIVPAPSRRSPTRQQAVVVAVGAPGPGASAALDTAFEEAERSDGWKQDRPGVRVLTDVVEGDLDAVLDEWSREAELLVMGQPAGRRRAADATSVLDRCHCPLMIVPDGSRQLSN